MLILLMLMLGLLYALGVYIAKKSPTMTHPGIGSVIASEVMEETQKMLPFDNDTIRGIEQKSLAEMSFYEREMFAEDLMDKSDEEIRKQFFGIPRI
jgi:hypothetical protein